VLPFDLTLLRINKKILYTEADIKSTIKTRKRISPSELQSLARKIKELRVGLAITQVQLAEKCSVKQATVARWEKGQDRPPGQALIVMGRLAGEPDKWWWFQEAGLQDADFGSLQSESRYALIPLLKDSIAAGIGRIVTESEIDNYLTFPKEWMPQRTSLTALKVRGDSMSPIIESGYIVLVDTSQRDPKSLIGDMVVAREGDALTVKWLRKEASFYQLVPQHTSIRHPVRILTEGQDFGIVGKVVKWIGEPPKKK
jgi:SOS-response transcriptional repressor LexA